MQGFDSLPRLKILWKEKKEGSPKTSPDTARNSWISKLKEEFSKARKPSSKKQKYYSKIRLKDDRIDFWIGSSLVYPNKF